MDHVVTKCEVIISCILSKILLEGNFQLAGIGPGEGRGVGVT
jgi:hypothetical protein